MSFWCYSSKVWTQFPCPSYHAKIRNLSYFCPNNFSYSWFSVLFGFSGVFWVFQSFPDCSGFPEYSGFSGVFRVDRVFQSIPGFPEFLGFFGVFLVVRVFRSFPDSFPGFPGSRGGGGQKSTIYLQNKPAP